MVDKELLALDEEPILRPWQRGKPRVRDKPATEREVGVDDDIAGARWPALTVDASRSIAIALWVAKICIHEQN